MSGTDWEKAVAERDEKTAALEGQRRPRTLGIAERLRSQIAELKTQGESDRIDFKLQLSGVRNVKAAALSADVMDVEENGVLECFVEAGAELQSTALLLHEFAHAGVDVCPHVCR
ncbi:MAG: hypothetical protein ACI362_02945 [Coriobacteriales bacterium]